MAVRTDLFPSYRPVATTSTSANELINKAAAGQLSPAEVNTLDELLDSPEFADQFSPQVRADLKAFINGKEMPLRAADELTSDLSKVKDARELGERMTADLALAGKELLEHSSLTREMKATRLFEFVVPYAKTLTQLAENPAAQKTAAAQLLKAAEKAGVGALVRQPDGKNGLEVTRELLAAKTPDDVQNKANGLRFDAPIWPKDPIRQPEQQRAQADKSIAEVGARGPGGLEGFRPPAQILMPQQPVRERRVDEPEKPQGEGHDRSSDGGNRKLSSRMLWNVLHRFRSDGMQERESAAQREQATAMMVIGALVLAFLAVIIGVLVAL